MNKGQERNIDSIALQGRADTQKFESAIRSALKSFTTDVLHLMENLASTDPSEIQKKYRLLRGTVLTKYNTIDAEVRDQCLQHMMFHILKPSYVLAQMGTQGMTDLVKDFVMKTETKGQANDGGDTERV